jgi:hypothetical protein
LVGSVVVLVVLVAACVLVFPKLLYPSLSDGTLDAMGVRGKARLDAINDRFKLQNDARTALLQGAAGLAVFVGAYVTWRQLDHNRQTAWAQQQATEKQLLLSRQGQITERFTRAVDQLGNNEGRADVIIGGIYGLERIAHDSPDDLAVIAELLTAHVRSFAPWPPVRPGQYVEYAKVSNIPMLRTRAPDIQTVLTVLSRGRFSAKSVEIELEGVDLRRAELADAGLEGVSFRNVSLGGAILRGANLRGAYLTLSKLEEAVLVRANLQGATLFDVDLRKAYLGPWLMEGQRLPPPEVMEVVLGADLRGAQLAKTDLREAFLVGTDLRDTNLMMVDLRGAILYNADLRETDLDSVDLDGALANVETRWPAGWEQDTAEARGVQFAAEINDGPD